MPAIVWYVSALLIFSAIASLVAVIFHQRAQGKKREYEAKIATLEQQRASLNASLATETEKLRAVQGANDFDKYAGLAVSHLNRGIIVIDHAGIIRLLNDYAKRYVDLSADVGVPYHSVIHLKTNAQADDNTLFDEAFAGKTLQFPENLVMVSQHGAFPVLGSIVPLMTGSTVNALLVTFKDNSSEVTRVKEEQAFFSSAAHELRTPLTVIRMTVSLLKDKLDTLPREKVIEFLRRADETAERLVRLVNEFLNVSRIDQGRLEIVDERFDIASLTDEVIRDLSLLAKERNLYVHHDITASERMVVADRAKTIEVLSNLINNAIKYTVQGGITITHLKENSTLVTTVTDTGSGIPKEEQGLLFKRFGQAGQARLQGSGKSSGLGLYIAKRFAQLMRGDVTLVKSEPGVGTTFALTLPSG